MNNLIHYTASKLIVSHSQHCMFCEKMICSRMRQSSHNQSQTLMKFPSSIPSLFDIKIMKLSPVILFIVLGQSFLFFWIEFKVPNEVWDSPLQMMFDRTLMVLYVTAMPVRMSSVFLKNLAQIFFSTQSLQTLWANQNAIFCSPKLNKF